MPSILVTSGTQVLVVGVGVSSKRLGVLPSPAAFPPVAIGDRVFYVPQSDRMSVVQSDKLYRLGSPALGITAHQNNIFVLTLLGLYFIDGISEEATPFLFHLGSPVAMVASSGSCLLLAGHDLLWSFNFETLSLVALHIPIDQPAPIKLSSFGTVTVITGETFILQGASLVRGSLDVSWDCDARALVLPNSTTIDVDICDATPMLSPISEQEVPTECMVCMCELEDDPSVTLYCGHAFHVDCIRECLKKCEEYCVTGDHIAFQSAKCPGGCGKVVTHSVAPAASSVLDRKRQVEALAQKQLHYEAQGKSEEDLLFYVCSQCRSPFYGGLRHCPRMMGKEPAKSASDLVCDSCISDFSCPDHGRTDVLYKCRFCCNPAVHRSFGSYYICDSCDQRWTSSVPDVIPCNASLCPLGGSHQEGTYVIGCGLCNSHVDWSRVSGWKRE